MFRGRHTKLIITCPDHGDFKQTPGEHLSGCGCSKCKESKGERAIALVLAAILPSTEVESVPEHQIPECRHKKPLRLDFALKESGRMVGIIEYNGEQHYEPVPFWGMSAESAARAFVGTQQRDAIKVQYAADNGIPLLIIPYWDFGNIEALVTGFLLQSGIGC